MSKNDRKRTWIPEIVLVLLLLGGLPLNFAAAQEPEAQETDEIQWISGPAKVDLGKSVAQVEMGDAYAFAGADDTMAMMEAMGNPSSGREVGMIVPKDENQRWFIVFEYFSVGYVKDDEKDEIDADALLTSIKEGTKRANEIRKEQGVAPFNVVGWYEEPHYDEASNNLVWTILGETEGEEDGRVANYNIRLLGRGGYMSVVLVTDPDTLAANKADVDNVIASFSFIPGQRYAEFVKGDKIAKYGLTALVAGGAATVAAKAGIFKLLAKFGKVIVLAVVAFLAAIRGKLKQLFSRREEPTHFS